MGPNLWYWFVVVVLVVSCIGGSLCYLLSPDSVRSSCEGILERSCIGKPSSNEKSVVVCNDGVDIRKRKSSL